MFKLRVSLGKNLHRNICWLNSKTAQNFGVGEGDIIIDSEYTVCPLRVEYNDLVREGEIALPTTIMFRLGAYIGEERYFKKVENTIDAKRVVFYVVGDIMDWIQYYRETSDLYVVLDDLIPVSPRVSVRVVDIEDGVAGEVYRISEKTNVELLFSGPMNLAIIIDASREMLKTWGNIRKIDLSKDISNILLEYNLRKAVNCAIFSISDDVDILLNWISIEPKLRWFMTKLIPRFVTDMIISSSDEVKIELALEYVLETFKKKNLGKRALNTILTIVSHDPSYDEKKIRNIFSEFREISNGVWRTIWVGIGDQEFKNLGKLAEFFGGQFIAAKTPSGLYKKCRDFADFRFIDKGWW